MTQSSIPLSGEVASDKQVKGPEQPRRGRVGRKGTSTSAFGSPGRIGHDASRFYSSRLYEGLPQETEEEFTQAVLLPGVLDTILCGSSERMEQLPDSSVQLMVTSPPYNVGKEYDEDLSLKEYLLFLERVWAEVHRVLVPGGRAAINVANLGRKPYVPLHAYIVDSMVRLGFLMRGEVIWNKASSGSPSTAWGSWRSAANPTLRDIHEYILIFSKGQFSRAANRRGGSPTGSTGGSLTGPTDGSLASSTDDSRAGGAAVPPTGCRGGSRTALNESTISRDEFLEFTKSVWTFPAEPAKKVGHPAPFPVELPYRLIQLFTFQGEVVLDPFMGSGQAAIAAIKAGRHYVGYDISPEYVSLAIKRVEQFRTHFNAPTIPGL